MTWVAVAVGGGALLSAGGGVMGAQSSNRQARRYQDEQEQGTAINNNRRGYSFLGMDPTENLMASGNYTAGTPASRQAASSAFNTSIGGPIYGQYQQLTADAAQGGADISRGYGADSNRLRGVGAQNVSRVGQAYSGGMNSLLSGYDQTAQGLTGMVGRYGQGQEAMIRRDAGQNLRNMNDLSKTALANSGLGNSTAVANSVTGNARRVYQDQGDALQRLGDSQIDRSVGLGRSLLSERSGYQNQNQMAANQALERGLTNNLSMDAQRSQGQTQLDETSLNRNVNMRGQNLASLQDLINNLTQNQGSQYIPQYSVAGTALNSAGQGLGGLGGMLALQQLYGKGG